MIRIRLARCVRLALALALIAGSAGLFGGCSPAEKRDAGAPASDLPGPPDQTNTKVKRR